MSDAHDPQLPDLHPAAAAAPESVPPPPTAGTVYQPFVAARSFDGRVAPGNPWTARVKLVAASRVGIHVKCDTDVEFIVQFSDVKGNVLFEPHRSPQTATPTWFNVPPGVAKIAVSFPGNFSRMASITVWLPTDVAGIPHAA